MIFNTHSHINDKLEQIPEIIDKCLEENVSKIAVVGYNYQSSLNAIEAANSYNQIYAICGLSPQEVEGFDGNFDKFEKFFTSNRCVAVGEIGLDYYYGKQTRDLQLKYFEKQLILACKYNLPVAIHCREAHEDTFNLLSKYSNKLKGIILHCYTGSVEMMQRYLGIGAYISITGVVTFKNAKTIKEVVLNCPIERLVVETDDPYLTPVPFRGKENHPSYVKYVILEIARIKNISEEEVIEHTYNNAMRVFGLWKKF